ncbi:MAG: hypothetical protein IIB05_00845 [Bacteroidetes bacterium]|nr:hypothetical protein [Bacteroidota bacterium]
MECWNSGIMERWNNGRGEETTGRLGDKEKFQTSNIWNFELLTLNF